MRRDLVRFLGFCLFLAYLALHWPLKAEWQPKQSGWIVDQQGRPLAETLAPDSVRSSWVFLHETPVALQQAFLAAEDSRFFWHPGIDFLALSRAFVQNIQAGRIVSGGSTLTQQLAKLLFPRPRTFLNKALEAYQALQLETELTKAEILEQYLNRAPFGNQLYGIRSAASVYLGKATSQLTPAECAWLAALPKSPTWLNPYRRPEKLLQRQKHILGRMHELGFLNAQEYALALSQSVQVHDTRGLLRAPHFVRHLLEQGASVSAGKNLVTTLDLALQADLEAALSQSLSALTGKTVSNGAIVVLDNQTRDVLAWVGSRNFEDLKEGQVDGVLALRQPGSTLKPFTYLTALQMGKAKSSSLLVDLPTYFSTDAGTYTPSNYDNQFHGPVRLRVALASSLNVPAVQIAEQVGPAAILRLLHAVGFASLDQEAEHYGLALTLGGGEVRLLELANAYATLAQHGLYRRVRLLKSEPVSAPIQAVDARAASLILDILSDDRARALTFGEDSILHLPFPAAVKTGTSKNFRDNWCVGSSSHVTVAVWVGNFSGQPMAQVSGVTGAGPLWRQAMQRAMRDVSPGLLTPHEGLVQETICALSGQKPTTVCPSTLEEWFLPIAKPDGVCTIHQQLWLDADEEALANLACPQAGDHPRLFEVYPVQFQEWAIRTGKLLPPSKKATCGSKEEFLAVGPIEQNTSGLKIVSPAPDGFYALDPGIPASLQKMRMKILAPPGRSVEWLLNGVILAQNVNVVDWPIQRGQYLLQVQTTDTEPRLMAQSTFTVK